MQGRGFCLLLIANRWKNKTNQEIAFQNFLGDRRLFGSELSAAAQCLGAASHRLRDAAAQAGVCHGPVSLGVKVLGLPHAKESPGCALAHPSTGFWTQVPRHGCTELGQVSAPTPPAPPQSRDVPPAALSAQRELQTQRWRTTAPGGSTPTG